VDRDPSLAPVRAVCFDFDGTLADSYAAITASVNHVRAAHRLPPLTEAEVKPHVGLGPANLLTATVPGVELPADELRYRAHHVGVLRSHTHLLPGALDAVRAVRHSGRHTAVCSNKPRNFTRELLDYLGLAPHLDALFGPEDVARPKPAPDMLLAALAKLNVPAAETLYVGDMRVDIQAGRAAGVHVWVVPTGSDAAEALRAARPDRLLRDLHELVELVG
jgi:phosphoglycolate phosphatase